MAVPFDPDPTELRYLGRAAVDLVVDFVGRRAIAPAVDLDDAGELVETLLSPPTERGHPFADLLSLIGRAADVAVDTAGPGYMAYIPGGGLPAAAIAELVALAVNRYPTVAALAPPLTATEAGVTRWLCDLVGFPPEAAGILTSGGSMATFSAIAAARDARLGDDPTGAVLYASDQIHHSVAKAARIAGLPPHAVRVLPADRDLCLDPGALTGAIEADRAGGRRPFLVVASAGTTNTGAVDPLDTVADVARDHDLWLHVDAAYGGFFLLTERGRARFEGIARADSVTLDPHKGMFLPYGTGALVVRDGDALRAAHRVGAIYLQDLTPGALPDFADYSPELSRELRGLRVWLPLQLHGVAAFRDALDEKLDLARAVHEALAEVPELELPWDTELSVVAFRHRDGDEAGRRLLERVNASRRVFLSSTTIDGRFVVRVCILSHRTHRDRVDEAIELIRDAV